ncbi:MAG TPA: exosortase/archaeosortase family protein [Limosilactobacillus reuteri]|nr:exosortase/archaeosortase family protein [Limosilactobacillus reuteri]
MPFKEHKYFPPSLKSVCDFWCAVIGIVLAMWGISYFAKWNVPFIYILLAILGLFIINLVYNYHLEFQAFQELNDKYNDLKSESCERSTVKVKDKERGISLEINGKEIKNPQLKEIVQITLDRYKHSNEEERKKWIQEGRKKFEDEILNSKW